MPPNQPKYSPPSWTVLYLSRLPSLLLYPTSHPFLIQVWCASDLESWPHGPLYRQGIVITIVTSVFFTNFKTTFSLPLVRDYNKPSLPRKSNKTTPWTGSKLKTIRSSPKPILSLPNHPYLPCSLVTKEGRNLKRINLSYGQVFYKAFVVSGPPGRLTTSKAKLWCMILIFFTGDTLHTSSDIWNTSIGIKNIDNIKI